MKTTIAIFALLTCSVLNAQSIFFGQNFSPPASGPVTLFSDSFPGTAGTALNGYNLDYNIWNSSDFYDCHISTPNGGVASSSTPCSDYITGFSWTTNQWIQMKLAKVPSAQALVCINGSSPYTTQNAYCAGANPQVNATLYYMFKIVSGTSTLLQSYSQTPTAGDTIYFQNNGGTLTLKVNGTALSPSVADSTFTGGDTGFIIYDSGGTNSILSTLTAGHL